MRVRTAVIGMLTLASLAGCGGYGGTGTYGGGGGGYGGGGGGGGGGGPVGSVTAGPGIEFVSGHNGSSNAAVDTIARSEEHTSALQSPTNLVCRPRRATNKPARCST